MNYEGAPPPVMPAAHTTRGWVLWVLVGLIAVLFMGFVAIRLRLYVQAVLEERHRTTQAQLNSTPQ